MKVYYKRYFITDKDTSIPTRIRMEKRLEEVWNPAVEEFNKHIADWNAAYDKLTGRKPGEHVDEDRYNNYIAGLAFDIVAMQFNEPTNRFWIGWNRSNLDLCVIDRFTGSIGHFEFKEAN